MHQCVAKKRLFVRYRMAVVDIICSQNAGERSVTNTKMVRGYFIEIARNNTGSVAYISEIAQEKEGERGQLFFLNDSLLS